MLKFNYKKFQDMHGGHSRYDKMPKEFLEMCKEIGDEKFTSTDDSYRFSFNTKIKKRYGFFDLCCDKFGEMSVKIYRLPLSDELNEFITSRLINAIYHMTKYGLIEEIEDVK